MACCTFDTHTNIRYERLTYDVYGCYERMKVKRGTTIVYCCYKRTVCTVYYHCERTMVERGITVVYCCYERTIVEYQPKREI